jgi:hypothetical protein
LRRRIDLGFSLFCSASLFLSAPRILALYPSASLFCSASSVPFLLSVTFFSQAKNLCFLAVGSLLLCPLRFFLFFLSASRTIFFSPFATLSALSAPFFSFSLVSSFCFPSASVFLPYRHHFFPPLLFFPAGSVFLLPRFFFSPPPGHFSFLPLGVLPSLPTFLLCGLHLFSALALVSALTTGLVSNLPAPVHFFLPVFFPLPPGLLLYPLRFFSSFHLSFAVIPGLFFIQPALCPVSFVCGQAVDFFFLLSC